MVQEQWPGVLVAFEGIDGSGKSTQATLLKAWGEGLGFQALLTKEPTNGPFGMKIRNSMFDKRMSPEEELECFVQDRRQHVEQELSPALAQGKLVLIDRYYYSTVAYQGARGLDREQVLAKNRAFAPKPDVVFLIDLDPRQGLERVRSRGLGQDLFENLDELLKVRALFHWLAQREPHLVTIDATQGVDAVHRQVTFELVKRVLLPRLASLSARLKVPPNDPRYQLVEHAQRLAADPTLSPEERARRLGGSN